MATAREIIRAAIPDADDETCEYILWGRTPFPMGRVDAKALYKAASSTLRAERNGVRLCDHCDGRAEPDSYECKRCGDVLRQARCM